MMRINFFLFLVLILNASVFAQSGRVKPAETPTPSGIALPSRDKPQPKPTVTPKTQAEEEETLRIESTLVPIPVSVSDQKGLPVRNLRIEDFFVKIDDIPIEISDISRAETPVRLAMLFDNSSSAETAREFEKRSAIRFFKKVLRPDKDLAALYSVSTIPRLEVRFTKNIGQLTDAVEMLPKPEGATALLDAIVSAAEYLGDAAGRRVIVIVSDGDDTISDATFEAALKSLQLYNVQVFVVKTTDFENFQLTGTRGGNANIRQLAAERRMQEIAQQTGGAVFSPIDEKELDEAFADISTEISQQYVLNVYPEDNANFKGKMRTISVEMTGNKPYRVRARKGFYVPKR